MYIAAWLYIKRGSDPSTRILKIAYGSIRKKVVTGEKKEAP
jgi:hypothetical protein